MSSIVASAPATADADRRAGWRGMLAVAAFAYFVLVGATTYGEIVPPVQVLNYLLLAPVAVAYALGIRRVDRIDRAALLALLLFAGAALLSTFPRQSLDAALGAFAYAAALFVARDILREPRGRAAFRTVTMGLSIVVSVSIAAIWLPLVLEWWSLTDWTVLPPLNLELPGGRWGHRHDAALLVVMLYPAWWIGRPSPLRVVLGAVMGILAAILVVIDGSRTLWLALVVATVVVGAPAAIRALRRLGNRAPAAAFTVVGVLAVGFVLVSVSVVDRVTNLFSLDYRFAMWSELLTAWRDHPVGGLGPGSFPWILQTTGYFDTNFWAPRHPDNAIIQVVAEAGVLGLIGLVAITAAVIPPLAASSSKSAKWAIVVFAIACLGANPTDFAFLVAVAIGWVAYALPHQDSSGTDPQRVSRWPHMASLGALGVIALFLAAFTLASFSNAAGVVAIGDGRYADADGAFSTAIAFDPGMAAYRRERGLGRVIDGRIADGEADLERAAALNPSDDLIQRGLAIAALHEGDPARARAAADRATSIQRSDPANLLLVAYLAIDSGDEAVASVLAEAVHAWPTLPATDQWPDLLALGAVDNASVVADAADRAAAEAPTPWGNPQLLAAIAGGSEPPPSDLGLWSEPNFQSYRCGDGVTDALASGNDSDKRLPVFWGLVIRESARAGDVDERAVRLLEIMLGGEIDEAHSNAPLSVLSQYDFPWRIGIDTWGYRRPTARFSPIDPALPLPDAGTSLWTFDPLTAHDRSGMPPCGG